MLQQNEPPATAKTWALGLVLCHCREREALSSFSLNEFQEVWIICSEEGEPAARGHLPCHVFRPQDGAIVWRPQPQHREKLWGEPGGTMGKTLLHLDTENSRTFNLPLEPRGPEFDGGPLPSPVRFGQLSTGGLLT